MELVARYINFVLRPAAVKNIMISNGKSRHDDGALLSRKKRPFLKRCFYPLPAPAGLCQKIVLKEIFSRWGVGGSTTKFLLVLLTRTALKGGVLDPYSGMKVTPARLS
jgi:hypothetical protein